jgi:four helix bundle protein
MEDSIHSYKDLIVWQKAADLAVLIYEITETFPTNELYGLVSQMRRCAISIISNIAEGRRRGSRKDFHQFLTIAYGSGAELEAQIIVVKRLSFGSKLDFEQIDGLVIEIMKMLNKMLHSI